MSTASAVRAFVEALDPPPQLLALGEPTHGEPAFPRLRNEILAALAGCGFRSIAVESDRVAALRADDFVQGGDGTLDAALAGGFSHTFGDLDGNRELLTWLRTHNEGRPAAERLTFHGFDAPLEMTGAPSPRTYLEHVQRYLHGDTDLDALLGPDERWSDPAAVMDADRSVGRSAAAAALRAVADDLLTALHAGAPRLVAATSIADWRRAEVHAKAALGLLRYHAEAARPAPPAERTSRLLGIRDALMAQHLLDIRAGEAHRGPTLVFGHNRHVQRHPSRWRLAGMDLEWASAGAVVAALLGDRYTVIIGSLGASAALGLAAPAPDTFEGVLPAAAGSALVDPVRLRAATATAAVRADTTAEQGYFPLDLETIEHCDAVLHITDATPPHPADAPVPPAAADVVPPAGDDEVGPGPAGIAARILALPEVEILVADEASGAPQGSWGDRFCYVGPDRRRPFATIVEHDEPGFDEASQLDRPGVYRLNVELGREAFEREFGYLPAVSAQHHEGIDFTRSGVVLPHPAYGTYGWASIVSPGPAAWPEVDRLIGHAHGRALARHHRARDRQAPTGDGPGETG